MAQRSSQALYERIYAMVESIPRGRVATYAQIAREAGAPRHALTASPRRDFAAWSPSERRVVRSCSPPLP